MVIKYYWLIFNRGQSTLQNLFCNNYGHITLLSCDNYNWYVIDPRPGYLSFEILAYDIKENVPLLLKKEKDALKIVKLKINYTKIQDKKFKWWSIFIPRFISCVSIIKYILGIKIEGFTPYEFYRNLKYLVLDKNILQVEEI